jgi:1-acyl-sn-glycerol-3-phosphate acyltransferase
MTMEAENKKKEKKTVDLDTKRKRINRFFHIVYPIAGFFYSLVHPIKVLHRERFPEGAALVCPNHTGLSDPVIMMLAGGWNGHQRPMAKQELLDTPVLGKIVAALGVFGVRRGGNDVGAIKTAIRYLKAGDKVIMFPEGTRVAEGEDLAAKNGVAMIALKTGAPIFPVYISPKKRWFRWTYVVFGEAFTPTCEGKRPTEADYRRIGAEWKEKVRLLGEELK